MKENEELKENIKELELRSLDTNLGEENQSLKDKINLLEKRLKESKSILNVEIVNTEREKRILVEDNEMLSNKTLELEQKVKTLEENEKSLDLACSKLNARNNELLNQVKELEEH